VTKKKSLFNKMKNWSLRLSNARAAGAAGKPHQNIHSTNIVASKHMYFGSNLTHVLVAETSSKGSNTFIRVTNIQRGNIYV